jgi:hypothetical protein
MNQGVVHFKAGGHWCLQRPWVLLRDDARTLMEAAVPKGGKGLHCFG